MRVLPPGGPPKRVNSGPFPGAEPHALCKAKPVKLNKVAFGHFFDTLAPYAREYTGPEPFYAHCLQASCGILEPYGLILA